MKRKVSILGATGSVGGSTLDLVERSPDRFEVVALTAASNAVGLAQAARRTGARLAVIADESKLPELQQALAGTECRAASGRDALIEAAAGEAEGLGGEAGHLVHGGLERKQIQAARVMPEHARETAP